ncbi:prokaryotic cytochrome C oxidase subunit IV family protein [Actinomadura craniellae]|uniref:Prokaryotic cytochrome C oxidase subunit IV family protein n=1 Tax=Actinomadura craniellae TaxID=2231787 RepID=A0A365GVG5_9ACTN|nr:cytochrome C oxidase subunit IV family protein [Actinomadura craniellae]RAY10800.1 prokaryotic cytochrome C oxidase subunit IV family protein [Actinomadura craniellae]
MTTSTDRDFTKDKRTVLIVWAALSAATILAWLLTPGESQTATTLGKELVAAIVVLGLIKCRLIIHYFMEVRHAPRWLQATTDGWLVVLWLTLLIIYLV